MEKQNITNILTDRMSSYSAYVLLNRAIPNLFDGLKPVHRRILYSMYKHKTYNFAKSANVTGRIMMLHPHGDSYPSMVGMVQNDRHENPLLEGKGNFGQYTSSDLQPAASRYSEVRLAPITKHMLQDFDKNVVDFIDNYDGTQKVPELLPTQYPTILTLAQKGIGVGFSSSIPSSNLKEVCEATINYIDGNDYYLIPDFATGGYIENNKEQFNNILDNGIGTVTLRGKIEVNKNEITIKEIPYGTTREKIIEDIIKGVKNNTLPDVKNVNDLTDLKGMRVLITLKKNADVKLNKELLYKHTALESKYSVNINVLADNKLKVLGVRDIITKWTEWRRQSVVRVVNSDIDNLSKKVHLYEGLEKILLDIDKAIDVVRNTSGDKVIKELEKHFKIDEEQANFVLKMQLKNINKDYLQLKIDEIENMKQELEKLKHVANSKDEQFSIIKKQLKDVINKHGKNRFTKVSEFKVDTKVEQALTKKQEKEIDKHVDEVIITKQGFLYKNYKKQNIKLSPSDEVVSTITNTNDKESIYLIFSDSDEGLGIAVNDIKESTPKTLGQHINTFNNKFNNSTPLTLINPNLKSKIVYIYSNGKASVFDNETFNVKRKLLKNAKHKQSDLLYAKQYTNDFNIKLHTNKQRNKVVNINTKDIKETKQRNSTGVYVTKHKILKLEED